MLPDVSKCAQRFGYETVEAVAMSGPLISIAQQGMGKFGQCVMLEVYISIASRSIEKPRGRPEPKRIAMQNIAELLLVRAHTILRHLSRNLASSVRRHANTICPICLKALTRQLVYTGGAIVAHVAFGMLNALSPYHRLCTHGVCIEGIHIRHYGIRSIRWISLASIGVVQSIAAD